MTVLSVVSTAARRSSSSALLLSSSAVAVLAADPFFGCFGMGLCSISYRAYWANPYITAGKDENRVLVSK